MLRSELAPEGGVTYQTYGMFGGRPVTGPGGGVVAVSQPPQMREPLPTVPQMPHRTEHWVTTGPPTVEERRANAERSRAADASGGFAHQRVERYVAEPQAVGTLADTIRGLQQAVASQGAALLAIQQHLGLEPKRTATAPAAVPVAGAVTPEQWQHHVAHQVARDVRNGFQPLKGGPRHPTVR